MRTYAARMRHTGALTTGALAAAVALAAAGCGSSSNPSAAGSATHHPMTEHSHMPGHHAMTQAAPFGSDCTMVPASGMGSFHGMSMDPAITAAMHNPLLTTFAADAKAAGLVSELDSMHALTVFAPANAAFHMLSGHEMSMMMHSTAELAKVLKYDVVSGRVTPAQIAKGQTLTTLEGTTLKASKMGSVYEVNDAHVLCGNIQTANATIYVIDKVLTPMH